MNELRMYVEHLFEGKVLTPENIDLKEEIYGNLVARYEDLIAGGASQEEALRLTKESMTSVDDVLDVGIREHSNANSGDVAAGSENGGHERPASDSGSTDTASVENGPELHAKGGPTSIDETGAAVLHPQPAQAPERKRVWPVVLAVVLAAVLLLGIGVAGCSLMFGIRSLDQFDGDTTASVGNTNGHAGDEGANGGTGSGDGAGSGAQGAASPKNREIFVDESGQIWVDGEPGDDLAAEVVNAGYGVVGQYLDTTLDDPTRVEALIHSLPLGGNAADIDVTKGVETLAFAYREVPEAYDGDSVDAALAYDVTALFCAMPLVNEIQITLTESDEPLEEGYYVFTRDDVQGCYGVRLDDQMVNEAGWHQIKDDNLYRRKFIEHMLDAAEREWR